MKKNENEINEKQNLKNTRVKSFFIEAAKEIILIEGVENISVRKVADRAGYTFATIYNYFKDLNELLQEVKIIMLQDVWDFIKGKLSDRIYNLDDIKKTYHTYVEYYLNQPHIFRFLYSYRLNPVSAAPLDLPDYDLFWQITYHGFVLNGSIQEADIPVISKATLYSLHGMLALYFSDNGMTRTRLYEDLDSITEFLIKERK